MSASAPHLIRQSQAANPPKGLHACPLHSSAPSPAAPRMPNMRHVGDGPIDLPVATPESGPCMNLAGIDFVSIRLVVLCDELGSLSAAARRAHLSLSSASHRLSNLERYFKSRFFERDHLGLHPTTAGRLFANHARAILQTLRLVRHDLDCVEAGRGNTTSTRSMSA